MNELDIFSIFYAMYVNYDMFLLTPIIVDMAAFLNKSIDNNTADSMCCTLSRPYGVVHDTTCQYTVTSISVGPLPGLGLLDFG